MLSEGPVWVGLTHSIDADRTTGIGADDQLECSSTAKKRSEACRRLARVPGVDHGRCFRSTS
jgi:hypothetical protein